MIVASVFDVKYVMPRVCELMIMRRKIMCDWFAGAFEIMKKSQAKQKISTGRWKSAKGSGDETTFQNLPTGVRKRKIAPSSLLSQPERLVRIFVIRSGCVLEKLLPAVCALFCLWKKKHAPSVSRRSTGPDFACTSGVSIFYGTFQTNEKHIKCRLSLSWGV